ncbi:ABC transporter ATP-binding protein [Pleomorphomonas sp. NRK KF1]|uniref:ABC transporter ATP-binding protein n=1 Tax=Pleomorphomonas sp. NRK KF1 TaxID=2943000 RepID=UPI00204489AF|nr:ABC transporter ATP-binding protein [Pleomorphomonas sp. NRK KF1]MCM5553996.1 ABC transporter ATP-binding protein [Pleomorphomonas sp. NRK KF1]
MSAAVEITAIEKRYGDTVSLRSASLSVRPGEFMTLVGPSGCGKSTLLRIIAGLAPQTSGEIAIGGEPVDHLPPKARDVAMVFQSYALYPHMTVAENIATPLRMRELPRGARLPLLGRLWPGVGERRARIRAAVTRAAEMVEIDGLLARRPATLSGGQRQRVALARAIVRHPRVFLMDEPLSNLDARLRVAMRGEITALHQKLGATFIYVTHDQVEAMTMSSRVAVMMDGGIVQCASPAELYADPRDLRVARFIGSPEINVLSVDALIAANAGFAPLAAEWKGAAHAAFRPEALRLVSDGPGLAIACRVERVEGLGHETLVFLRTEVGGHPLTARLQAGAFALFSGDSAVARLSPDDVLLFDGAGQRLDRRHVTPTGGYAHG